MRDRRRFRLADEPDEAPFTVAEFVAANDGDGEDYEGLLGRLAVGERVTFGGGAAAECTVVRVHDTPRLGPLPKWSVHAQSIVARSKTADPSELRVIVARREVLRHYGGDL